MSILAGDTCRLTRVTFEICKGRAEGLSLARQALLAGERSTARTFSLRGCAARGLLLRARPLHRVTASRTMHCERSASA